MWRLRAAFKSNHWRGLGLLLVAAFAFDLLRALTVPAGVWNIDESFHFVDSLNAARFLSYEIGRIIGSAALAPEAIGGGTIPEPQFLFHPPGGLPLRGTGYLLVQAVPQLFLDGAPEAGRLLVARLVSILLHLLTIGLTYATLRRLRRGRIGSACVPLAGAALAAFVPSYSDMMSAVNVDVGAAAAGAVYLFALVHIIQLGAKPGNVAALLAATAFGLSVKETFWPLVPATMLALAWGLSGWRARLAGATAACALAALALFGLKPFVEGGAAYWFNAYWEFGHDAELVPRAQSVAPTGSYVMRFTPHEFSDGIVQFVPETRLSRLGGQTLTWGAWLRASDSATVALSLRDGETVLAVREAVVGPTWAYFASAVPLASRPGHLALYIVPPETEAVFEVDGAVVAVGNFAAEAAPTFRDESAASGDWAGQPFDNLLLNASAEVAWPQIIPAYNAAPRNLNTRLNAVLDWPRTLPAFAGLARWLLANFWSAFGGLLPGLSPWQLIPFALLSAWAAVGLAAILPGRNSPRADRREHNRDRMSFLVLLAASLASWLVVLYRSDFVPNTAQVIVWSVSRHASAGLSATAALLALGIFRLLPRSTGRWALLALFLGLFAANAWILLRVQIPVYHCLLPLATDCLPTVH